MKISNRRIIQAVCTLLSLPIFSVKTTSVMAESRSNPQVTSYSYCVCTVFDNNGVSLPRIVGPASQCSGQNNRTYYNSSEGWEFQTSCRVESSKAYEYEDLK